MKHKDVGGPINKRKEIANTDSLHPEMTSEYIIFPVQKSMSFTVLFLDVLAIRFPLGLHLTQ